MLGVLGGRSKSSAAALAAHPDPISDCWEEKEGDGFPARLRRGGS